MARALSGEQTVEEYYDDGYRQLGGIIDGLARRPDLLNLTDEEILARLIEPRNGSGGWVLKRLTMAARSVQADYGVTLLGLSQPLAKLVIALEPDPRNATTVTLRSGQGWFFDPRLERTASFNRDTDSIEILASHEEITELTSIADRLIDLINDEIDSQTPTFRQHVASMIADKRLSIQRHTSSITELNDRLALQNGSAVIDTPDRPVRFFDGQDQTALNASVTKMPDDLQRLAKASAILSAILAIGHSWEHQGTVGSYNKQVKLLIPIDKTLDSLTISDDEMRPFTYASDESGTVTSSSETEFVSRDELLPKLTAALGIIDELIDKHPERDPHIQEIQDLRDQQQRERERQTSGQSARRSIVSLMRLLVRFLRAVDDWASKLDIPPRQQVALQQWVETINAGELSAAAWSTMVEDIEDLDTSIRVSVDGHPSHDYYSLPSWQQQLLFNMDFLNSTMVDIEILQLDDLQSGLDIFNRSLKAGSNQRHGEPAPVPSLSRQIRDTPGKTVVSLGHGRNLLWRELGQYLDKTLGLEVNDFESKSRVGQGHIQMLESLLEGSEAGIVLLTAEDLQGDGQERARQNVIHETGLFQGRFGFARVAMIIQDGVEVPSNLVGIFSINFKDRHIEMAYHQIAEWLKRENLLP